MDEYIIHGESKEELRPKHSLGEHFSRRLQELGDAVALVQQVDGAEVTVTFSELLASARRLAGLLRSRGLGCDETVLLCIGNTLHFAPIAMATLFVGAALAPINPAFCADDLLHLINTLKPQVLIVNADAEARIREALARYDSPVQLIPIEEVDRCLAAKTAISEPFQMATIADTESHVAYVMCSSGTSGKPKGVEMVHATILALLAKNDFFPTMHKNDDTEREVFINLSGPYWVSCQLLTLICLSRGSKLILLSPFTEHTFLSHLEKYKVNFLILGPDVLVALAKYSAYSEFDLSSVTHVLYGGAPMSRAMLAMADQKFNKPVTVMYGMTECMTHMMPAYGRRDKPLNVGYLAANTAAKVVDINTGATLPAGKEGELCFKSRMAFKGYRGNAQATRDVFDADGFLHTGDVGYYDADGYFYIVDRIKELIKYRRDHVPATDIEDVLLKHPQVSEVAVFGVFHETDWEHATACVVLASGATVTAAELLSLVEGSLPEFKWLHGGLHFVTSLPRTASGKIQKHELRKQYAQQTRL